MKHLNQFITEYIVKKKLDNPIDSEDHYEYFPKTKEELIENIKELIKQDIYDFNCIDTSEITDMSDLFNDIQVRKNFNVSKWNVSNVKYINGIFNGCKYFDCDLSKWDVSNVKNMLGTFSRCENLNCDLSNWDVSNILDMTKMFYNCTSFEGVGIEKWDVSSAKYIDQLFFNCNSLKNNKLKLWNTINVKDAYKVFDGCTSLKNKPRLLRKK